MSNPGPTPSLLSPEQIRAMLDAAWSCRTTDPQEAIRLSRLVLEQPLEDQEQARASFCLGFGLVNEGEFRAAEPELRRALGLFGELEDRELQRDSLKWLGVAQNEQGRPVEALTTFIQVRHLSAALGDSEGEITALSNIAAAYSTMADHPNALEYHLLALGLSRQQGLLRVERIALSNLSAAYNEMGRHGDALQAALACLKVQMADPMLDAMACQNAGDAHFGLKQFVQARAMYLKTQVFFENSGNQIATASLAVCLGRVGQQQGAGAEARELFEHSLEIQQQTGDTRGQNETLLYLAELLGTSGQLEDALSALHRAQTLAEEGQLRDELCKVDLILSGLYRQAGRYQEALTHLERHLQLNGELFSAASDQRLQSLRVQFELEQAERERQTAQRLNAELSEVNARLEATNRDLTVAQARTAELMARLEQHANEDALTGLLNRRAFDAALAGLLPEQQVSVVLCDIDHFKAVNDRFSHLVGDEVLRQVATLLRGHQRPDDLLARYGGEEFILLMTGTSQAATLEVCERLRGAIENHDWSTVRAGLSLTLSLGAAMVRLQPAKLSVRDVMQVADDTLYAAKNAGRNRVELRLLEP